MRILLVTTKYPEAGSEWLTNELAEELSKKNDVLVCAISWNKNDPTACYIKQNEKLHLLRVQLPRILYCKWRLITQLKMLVAPLWALYKSKKIIDNFKPTIGIFNTPAVLSRGIPRYIKKRFSAKTNLILWDFFPYYMKDLGAVTSNVKIAFLLWLENREYLIYDKIFCMTNGNRKFLHENYRGVLADKTCVMPLWTKIRDNRVSHEEKLKLRSAYAVDPSSLVAIYGGAISIAQRVESILNYARASHEHQINVQFLILGSGTEEKNLKEAIEKSGLRNIYFMGSVSRHEYFDYLKMADIGLVMLSGALTVPSFPSKSLDYMSAGLPIFASIDDCTDYKDFIEIESKAGVVTSANNIIDSQRRFIEMVSDVPALEKMSKNSYFFYKCKFDVVHAAKIISK